MSFASIEFPDYPRPALRKMRASATVAPPVYIDEIVDIACHAAASGRRTVLEVLDRSSDPRVAVTAIGMAISLLRSDLDRMEAALTEYAEASGKPVHRCSVEVGNG